MKNAVVTIIKQLKLNMIFMRRYQLSILIVNMSVCVYHPSGISFNKLQMSVFITLFHKSLVNKIFHSIIYELIFAFVWESTLYCPDMVKELCKLLWFEILSG